MTSTVLEETGMNNARIKKTQNYTLTLGRCHMQGVRIGHSWDVLLGMGSYGPEVALPRLLEGSCNSQTVSSLSFGTKGGKSVDLDIITNLGENYYVECGKRAIVTRRCMKQRYIELRFTKTVSSGRAIYINNLVNVGPSKPVLRARC